MSVPPLPVGVPALPSGTRYGEKLAVGIGYSTILAEMDFETFSPAGFVWDESVGKFRSPRGATKKGLSAVGAANYTLHPDAEVLHLAYDLKDGKGGRRWKPGEPLPLDLFQHLADGKLLEAHNVGFDAQVWENICVPKYGFPPLPHAQLRCSMAKARAHALPGKLSEIGDVLNLDLKKDKEGERLIKMFTHPRDPTAKDPRTRIMPEDEPEEFEKFRKYGDTDIGSEAEASSKIPDLSPTELAYWQMDQRINRRGMQVDMASVDACLAILDQVYPKYNLRLSTITGGQVSEASKVEALKKWLRERGVPVGKKLGEEEALVILKGLPEGSPEHEALTIRLMIGSAAVKKIYALKRRTTAAQRLHDMYTYCGARTGRATGAGEDGPGVQGQNLPNSGPLVYRCDDMTCRKFFGRHHEACPWCGSTFYVKKDWCPEAVEDALSVVHTRSLVAVEYFFGNAVKVISGSLRGLLVAGPGKRLICSDFSSIEGVVTAFVAGEEWMMEVYRTHGKIYEATASQITGIPFEEFMRVAGYTDLSKPNWWLEPMTGAHHPMRKKIGKPGALGCFAAETQVLTDRGLVAIVDVTTSDKLWDGIEWVKHSGLAYKGRRSTINLDGVDVTPEHKITCGSSWQEASQLASNESSLRQCLGFASGSLPQLAYPNLGSENFGYRSSATAGRPHISLHSRHSEKVLQRAATPALRVSQSRPGKCGGSTRAFCLTTVTGYGCSTACRPASHAATIPKLQILSTTAVGGLKSGQLGVRTVRLGCPTSSRCRGGTGPSLSLTERIAIKGTNLATCGSSLQAKTRKTDVKSECCKKESMSLKPVYDLLNSGPRSRFTIKTSSGWLVVHNSGFGGWVGAWKRFGADEFLTDEEIKDGLKKWRAKSPNIVEMWGGQFRGLPWDRDRRPELYGLEGMIVSAILHPGREFSYRMITYFVRNDVLYCRLPSGRTLDYHQPRLSPSTRDEGAYRITFWGHNSNPTKGPLGWICMELYGGIAFQNVVQAIARDIMFNGMLNLEERGYPIVLHTHDEPCAEVPEGWGSIEEFEAHLTDTRRLPWCAGWPIKAAGGWAGFRYRKD